MTTYGFLALRVKKYMTSVLEVGSWAKNMCVAHDIMSAVVDLSSSAGVRTAQALTDYGVNVTVVNPTQRKHPVDLSVFHCPIHRLDMKTHEGRIQFAMMCDKIIIMPDCDYAMLQSRQNNNPFGTGEIMKLYDYNDVEIPVIDAHDLITRNQDAL